MIRRVLVVLAAALVAAAPAVGSAQWGPVFYSQGYRGCWQFGCADAVLQMQQMPTNPGFPGIPVEVLTFHYDLVPFGGEGALPRNRNFPCPPLAGDTCYDVMLGSFCFIGPYPTAPTTCDERIDAIGPADPDFDPRAPFISIGFLIGPSGADPSGVLDQLRPDERLDGLILTAIPEPAALALVASGLALVGVAGRRRRAVRR